MKKAAVYARYSSNNQREESITAQLRAARDYSKRKGYTIVQEYCDEALTGTNDNRPAFQQLIRDAKSGMFEIVIFHKIDRNARNEYDYYFHKAQLQKYGVHYEYVAQNIDDSPEGQMTETLLVGMAAYYSRNLAKEAMKGMRENAYQARHNGGTPPLGYNVDPEGKYIINEEEAAIVRLIFERRAAGYGYGQILSELNEKGYRTKRGGRFGKNSLHDLLRNKKYIGIYTFGRVSGGRAPGARNNHKQDENMIEIPDGIPAIISNDLWDSVKNRMEKDKHAPGAHKAKETYYLTGKVICANCGSSMVGGTFMSKGFKYSYYRCSNNNKMSGCKGTRIKREWLESAVLQYIDEQLFAPEMIPLLAAEIKKRIDAMTAGHNQEKRFLEKQRTDAMRKIENLLDLVEGGQIDDMIRQRIAENKARMADAETRIKQIENAANSVLDESQVIAVLNSFAQKDKNPEQIRAIVETFVDRVTVSKDDYVIKLRLSFEWWRRGESNSCPKVLPYRLLRTQSVF